MALVVWTLAWVFTPANLFCKRTGFVFRPARKMPGLPKSSPRLSKSFRPVASRNRLTLRLTMLPTRWWAYGFSPIVESAGGDLINRQDFQSAAGVLNSDASVKALTTFQSWFKDGLVDLNEDDNAFKSGRSAISWVGFLGIPGLQKGLCRRPDTLTLAELWHW